LSRYLSEAGNGEAIEITSHRRVVARLVGVPRAGHAGLMRLLASGAAQWAGGKPRGTAVSLPSRGKTVSELLLEDRG
jgi:antitoxin (DNA-binding transcriptional repressor) of toxin-antitoxin stability system